MDVVVTPTGYSICFFFFVVPYCSIASRLDTVLFSAMSGRVQADFVLSAALCIFQFKVTVNLSRSDTSTPAFDLEKLQYLYTGFFFLATPNFSCLI